MPERISWETYSGPDVEDTVALMVCRERPNAEQITPSRGDGGVDILDPAPHDGSRGDIVLQIKSFTRPLGSSQWNQVEKSLRALQNDARWADLNVDEWRLVTPLNPTPEAREKLQKLSREHGFESVHWDGLSRINGWAATYPEVVDYYLHHGAEEIERARSGLVDVLKMQTLIREPESPSPGNDFDVAFALRELQAFSTALKRDPFYMFDLSTGEGNVKDWTPDTAPHTVATVCRSDGTHWVGVRIRARCARSLVERPISGTLNIDPSDPSYEDFWIYGLPLTADGSVSMSLPGGIGTPNGQGQIQLSPTSNDLGENPELWAEIVGSAGDALIGIDVDRVERTSGPSGIGWRALLVDSTGRVSFEIRARSDQDTFNIKPSFDDLAGLSVSQASPIANFIAQLRSPNSLRIERRYGRRGLTPAVPLPDLVDDQAITNAYFLEKLQIIQDHADEVIRIPQEEVSEAEAALWERSAYLLSGGHVVLEEEAVFTLTGVGLEVPSTAEWSTRFGHTVHVGRQAVSVGVLQIDAKGARDGSLEALDDGGSRLTVTVGAGTKMYVIETTDDAQVQP